MSGTQLVPAEPADDNTAVQRLIDATTEIMPSVQVTLAKRIMRPGSNRVMCLAAKTSAPIDDSEVASVSDLALKLSDGTNVVLSLSFFNDANVPVMEYAAATPYSPPYSQTADHYVYEPNRYNAPSDTKFAVIVMTVVLGALAGLYVAGAGPFSQGPYSFNKVFKPQHPAVTHKHYQPVQKPAVVKPVPVEAPAPAAHKVKPVAIVPAPRPKLHKTQLRNTAAHSRKNRLKQVRKKWPRISDLRPARMLVPPPPPITYSLPFPPPEAAPLPSVPAKAPVKSAPSSKPAGTAQSSPSLERLQIPGQ